ncbi:MAG TPA: hypothetical protein VFD05_03570 [Bacilli bacterium]|nr:hypothetical protein [Bacilli bacterium]
MQKRKLIFILMTTLLISGCNKNKESSSLVSSSSSINEPTTSEKTTTELTSSSEIIDQIEEQERIITAFHNLYLAPAVRFITSAPALTMEEKVYSNLNQVVEEETHEMSLSAHTEITDRANEDVTFKQEMNVELNDDSMYLLSYYALETLYLSFEDNDGNVETNAFPGMTLLKYLFGNEQSDELDLTFIDAFITESESGEIIAEGDRLLYSRQITNDQIATLLAQVIIMGNSEQNESSEQLLVIALKMILENYFNFEEFTMLVIVDDENNIEEITFDFALEVTFLEDLSLFDDLTLSPEAIFELIGKLLTAKTGERREALISGELRTIISIKDSIDIVAPEDFTDYLPQVDD